MAEPDVLVEAAAAGARVAPVQPPEPAAALHVDAELLTSFPALLRIEHEWQSLLGRCRAATAFQAPAWLLPWFDVWGRDNAHVVALRGRSGDLLALVPAVRLNGRLELGGCGISDYLAPLVDDNAVSTIGCRLDESFAAEACLFHDVPGDTAWPRADAGGWRAATASTCAAVALPDTADAFRAGLPHGLQRNLRRYGDRLAREARVRFHTVTANDELDEVLEALFQLHGMRWHERGRSGVFADELVRHFHHLAAPRLLQAGILRLHVLRADDLIVAAQYVLVHGHRALSYIGGFDPAWNRYSPGSLLMAYAIDHAIAEDRCTVFDLLRGTEAYKYTWGAVNHATVSFSRGGPARGC